MKFERRAAKHGAACAIGVILLLTVLEFPPPLGFETRPQTNVSPLWLVFFLVILFSEIAALPLLYKRPKPGALLGILAVILNMLQAAFSPIRPL